MSTEPRARSKSPYKLAVTNDEETDTLIRELIKKRAIVKGRLTRFSNYLNAVKSNAPLSVQTRADLKLRIQGASSLFKEFNDLQMQLEQSVLDVDLDEQLNQRDLFEDNYYNTVARAECMLGSGEDDSSSKKASNSDIKSVKLPTITIPTFDGSYEHWLEFRDTFQSLIHNSDHITSIQKFHYLKSSLKGSAALVIDSLEFSSDNYAIAWELLLGRYDNSRLLVHNHVKSLFTIQALTKESPDLLRHLVDTILKNIRALKLLGEPVDSWDTLIIYIVVTKLDKITEREWEQYKNTTLKQSGDSKSILKVNVLLTFLKDRADMLETLQVSHASTSNKKQFTNAQTSHKIHCNVSTDNPHSQAKKSCLICKQHNHPLYACQKFLNYGLEAKLKFVKDNRLCENCLRAGHAVNECRFGPCRKCEQKHNSLIHRDSVVNRHIASPASSENNKPVLAMQPSISASPVEHSNKYTVGTHTNILCGNYPCAQPVLLSTALVEVKDRYENYQQARALLDSGSERCIITQSLCEKLGAQLIQSTHEIRGVGNSISQSTQICDIEVKSRTNPFIMRMQCIVLPNITSTLPAIPKQHAQFGIPENIQLADPDFHESQSIDILIGADKFWDLLSDGKIRLPKGPFLQNTQLGWIVSGPINIKRKQNYIHCNFSQTVEAQLRKFWELEEIPKLCDTRSEEEKKCEDHFVKTTTRNSDGRFCVNIPLKSSTQSLGETYPQALNRFLSLEKRLQRDPEYKRLYTDFIHEYVSLGHMTRVDSHGVPNFFLPHHGVLREHSTTTKLRVVFNASAASSTGVSLNDLQLVGPPIQGDLLAILLRLRIHKYVACADVEKMYRQAEICETQRDLQLIIWRDDPTQEIGIYRHNRIVYGTAAAAFMACRCLKQTAVECNDPEVTRVINEDFFVDDMLTTLDDKDELLDLCEKTYKVLQSGCFPLRKWVFNFDCGDRASSKMFDGVKSLNLDESSHCKTLGIGWNNVTDEFHYNTQFKNDTKITKRSILSHVSQIFDPYGLLSPTIMIAKVLLQKLWLIKLDWDDTLPHDVTEAWNRFAASLSALENLRVPRHVIGIDKANYIELHIFTDASQTAYGSCAYIRAVNDKTGSASVRLLCSKGKVAPLKPVSIPRLELCGALLGAQLYSKIRESLHCDFKSVVFWTDSTIVLGWLRMAPSLLKTFVQNRVAEINEITKDLPWRHVSGKDNPADLVSRGCSLPDLSSSTVWWEGPPFLRDADFDCSSLASDFSLPIMRDDELPEVKASSLNVLLTKQQVDLFPFARFSQFERMRRAYAYVLRFINNTRNKMNRQSGALTLDELRRSELGLVRFSQTESFIEAYDLISKNQSLKGTPSLHKLNLFIDADKIMRVGGRINYAENFDYDKMHPILLCSKHPFSVLLMRHEHQRLFHAAPQALLYDIRQRWWPVGGRNLARKIVNDCVACKRLKGKTLNPIMASLPKERLSPTYPFLFCGVDFAGPVLTLNRKGRGAKTQKSYICLFVCFVTRAIHLELVSDLSTEAYILALKRFISRRAKPAEIFSDNGRNFVGAKNELSRFLTNCSSDISEYARSQAIRLRLIPAFSAHFGGLWEAGVKSCKLHLARVIGNAHLTFEELTTVLTQIEAILNSRPLSPLSSDPHDFLPLSPGHFLVGRTLTAPVYQDMRGEPERMLNRYQRVEQIRHNFWERWAKEYVSELQTRCKWRDNVDSLEPNTLVVIKDDKLPPLKWSLGRIINTISGKDGVSRVADIRTASGTIRRSFAKICPLFREEEAKQQEEDHHTQSLELELPRPGACRVSEPRDDA